MTRSHSAFQIPRRAAAGAAHDADVLLLLTEWPEFCTADPRILAKTVTRRAVLDARHALGADAWRAHGWDYRAPGRPAHPAGGPAVCAGVFPHGAGLDEAELAWLAAAS